MKKQIVCVLLSSLMIVLSACGNSAVSGDQSGASAGTPQEAANSEDGNQGEASQEDAGSEKSDYYTVPF